MGRRLLSPQSLSSFCTFYHAQLPSYPRGLHSLSHQPLLDMLLVLEHGPNSTHSLYWLSSNAAAIPKTASRRCSWRLIYPARSCNCKVYKSVAEEGRISCRGKSSYTLGVSPALVFLGRPNSASQRRWERSSNFGRSMASSEAPEEGDQPNRQDDYHLRSLVHKGQQNHRSGSPRG